MTRDDAPLAVDGVLLEQDGRSVLRFERRLRHPVERVSAALTEPEQLLRWWGEAELELAVGGRFVLRWRNTDEHGERFTMHATVTRLEPPHLLETSGDVHGVLRWELRADEAGGTLLRFSSTLDLPEEFRTRTLAGWHYHLDALEAHLVDEPIDIVELPNLRWERIHAGYLHAGVDL